MIATTAYSSEAAATLVSIINDQHDELLDAIERVRQLSDECSSTPLLIDAIEAAFEAAHAHFRHEERILELSGNPISLCAHRELHQHMLNHIVLMRRHLECFDRTSLKHQLLFLERWLTTHMSEEILKLSLKIPDEIDDPIW